MFALVRRQKTPNSASPVVAECWQMKKMNGVCLWGSRLSRLESVCIRKWCLLLSDLSVKRCIYGDTLLASWSKAAKRGACSTGIRDRSIKSDLQNTSGATFLNELRDTWCFHWADEVFGGKNTHLKEFNYLYINKTWKNTTVKKMITNEGCKRPKRRTGCCASS